MPRAVRKRYVVRLHPVVMEQITDMARGKNNAQCLSIATGIAHKFAIESSDEILAGTTILNIVKDILLQELRIEFQRGFAQSGINFI